MKSFGKRNIEESRLKMVGPINIVKKQKVVGSILVICFAILVSACANVDPKPFVAFNTAANQITALDTAIDPYIVSVKQREMDEISSDPVKTNNLFLNFDPDDLFRHEYKFSKDDLPIFIQLQRLDSGLTELNASFVKYTSLLAILAGDDLIKKEDFDQLASDLNSNLRSTSISLGADPKAQDLALFSTIASKATFEAVNIKRKAKLIEELESNQDTVDALISQAQDAIEIIRNEIVTEYENFHRDTVRASQANKNLQIQTANEILANSEKTAAALEMLKALNRTYATLAVSHKKLASSIKNDQLPSFSDLMENIKDVQKRYQDLKKINEDADKAE